jgi:hypothetical protein
VRAFSARHHHNLDDGVLVLDRHSMFAASCAARAVRAAVDDDATVGTYEVRKTRCLPSHVRRWKRFLLAQTALEQRAESLASTFGVGCPWARLKRRLVTYMPLVPTSELGNPGAILVLVVPEDLALHCVSVRRATRHHSHSGCIAEHSPTPQAAHRRSSREELIAAPIPTGRSRRLRARGR